MRRWHLTVSAVVAVVAVCAVTTVAQQQRAESRDMTLLGSNDLQARSAYQPVIQKQGPRYIASVGHEDYADEPLAITPVRCPIR